MGIGLCSMPGRWTKAPPHNWQHAYSAQGGQDTSGQPCSTRSSQVFYEQRSFPREPLSLEVSTVTWMA